MSGDILIVTQVGVGVLLASSGRRQGMSLNILPCTGQQPFTPRKDLSSSKCQQCRG